MVNYISPPDFLRDYIRGVKQVYEMEEFYNLLVWHVSDVVMKNRRHNSYGQIVNQFLEDMYWWLLSHQYFARPGLLLELGYTNSHANYWYFKSGGIVYDICLFV